MDRKTTLAVWTILNDRDFVRQAHHQLDPEDIPRGALRWIVAEAKRLWEEEKSLLTPDVLLIRTEEANFEAWGTSQEEVASIYLDINGARTWDDTDAEALRNIARKWLRALRLARGLEEASEAMEAGDYESAERSMSRGKHASSGFVPGMTWGPKSFPPQRRAVPTGIKRLDRWWLGGLHLGQLAFVLAPTNTGKSMLLPFFTAAALRLKMNVLYYTTELTQADVFKRVLSALVQVPINDILDLPEAEAQALARIERGMLADEGELNEDKGFFETRFRDPGSMTAADIAADLEELQERGIRIHLVVIDGDDLTLGGTGRKYDKFYEAYKEVYAQLSSLAKTWDVAIWTAAQAKLQAYKKAYLDGTHVADSLWKIRTSDMGLGINLTEKQKDAEQDRPYMQVVVVKDRHYGTRDRGIRLFPEFGFKGTTGTVGFEQPDPYSDQEDDDAFAEAEKA